MYAVVGCGECGALWIVEGRPETTECRRCGKRHRFDRLRNLAEADDEDAARDARSALLAERSGGEADLDSFAEMEARIDDAGVDDEEYLAGSGLDPEAIAAAGERPTKGSPGPEAAVRSALVELDAPTEASVVEYARERGVPEERAREILEKLVRAGEATRSGGRYRPV